MSFENKLTEMGYVKHVKENGKLIKWTNEGLSTMGHLYYYFVKGEDIVTYGLYLVDKPPMLVFSRNKEIIDMYNADKRNVINQWL